MSVRDFPQCNLLSLLAVCVARRVEDVGRHLRGGEGAANAQAACAARMHALG